MGRKFFDDGIVVGFVGVTTDKTDGLTLNYSSHCASRMTAAKV